MVLPLLLVYCTVCHLSTIAYANPKYVFIYVFQRYCLFSFESICAYVKISDEAFQQFVVKKNPWTEMPKVIKARNFHNMKIICLARETCTLLFLQRCSLHIQHLSLFVIFLMWICNRNVRILNHWCTIWILLCRLAGVLLSGCIRCETGMCAMWRFIRP